MNKNIYEKPLLTVETLVVEETMAFAMSNGEDSVYDDE